MFLPFLVVLPVVSGFRSVGFVVTDRARLGDNVCLSSSYLDRLAPKSTSAIKPGAYSISRSGPTGAKQPANSYSSGAATLTSPWPTTPVTSPLGNTPSPFGTSSSVNGAVQPAASTGMSSYIGNLSGPTSSVKPGAYSISKGTPKQPASTGIGSYLGNLASGPTTASYGSSATLSPPASTYSSSSASEPAGLGSYLDRLAPKSGSFKPGAYSISKGTPKQPASTGIGSYLGNLASGSTSSPVQIAVLADEARARLDSSINMMDSYLDNLAPKSGASYKPGKYSISKGIPKQPVSTGIGSYLSNLASGSSMSAADVKLVAQEARAKLEKDISTMTSYIDSLSPQSSSTTVPGKYSISNSSYKEAKQPASLTMSSYLAHLSNTPMDIAVLANEASSKVGDIMENTVGSTPAEKAIVELRKIVKALETIVELLEEMI